MYSVFMNTSKYMVDYMPSVMILNSNDTGPSRTAVTVLNYFVGFMLILCECGKCQYTNHI